RFENLVSLEFNSADFDDLCGGRVKASGFEINGDENAAHRDSNLALQRMRRGSQLCRQYITSSACCTILVCGVELATCKDMATAPHASGGKGRLILTAIFETSSVAARS